MEHDVLAGNKAHEKKLLERFPIWRQLGNESGYIFLQCAIERQIYRSWSNWQGFLSMGGRIVVPGFMKFDGCGVQPLTKWEPILLKLARFSED